MALVVPEQSQRPYRFGMTLLGVGALFNWLGLADTYSDPVPAIRYIGVGLIAAGASLICMAMCFWMRNIHDPNGGSEYDVSSDPIHVISSDPSLEKPPDYSTVVDVPPCYEDAIKLSLTPIVHALKHAPTTMHAMNQNAESNNTSCKNAVTERINPLQSEHSGDTPELSTTSNERAEKSGDDVVASQNSSQNENAFAKVFRKSIRGIRRLRSGSEDSNCEQPSSLENGAVCQDRDRDISLTAKVDR